MLLLSLSRAPNKGFTLIELLITVTIMLLIVGGGIAAFVSFNERQEVFAAVNELKGYLRGAQSRARVGDRPSGCNRLDGYEVSMTAGSSVVTLEAVCDTGDIERGQISLASTVTSNEDFTVIFYVLQGGVDEAQTITLSSTSGLEYQFEVTLGGEISEGALLP